MSIIGLSLFAFLVLFITVLQSAAAYFYFSEFFNFKLKRRLFLSLVFGYMLFIKFLPGNIWARIVLLLGFLGVLTAVIMEGTVEKKIYHVLSFVFSLALCELTFSMLIGEKGMRVETGYLKWMVIYFLVNILFLAFVIGMIKFFMYFRTENSDGLANTEYLILSVIPFASLLIMGVSFDISYLSGMMICVCLIFINLSYIVIYDRIGRKNYEIHRFAMIEEQNQYYQDQIRNQQEIMRMKHDLKNILLALDFCIEKNDLYTARKQLDSLLENRIFYHEEYTGCVAVDPVLKVKIQKMKENGICYNLNLQVPGDLKICESNVLDISAVMGDLLDNAIEAVLRLENDREKKIDITLQYHERKLIMNIQNTSKRLMTDFSGVLIKSEKRKDRYGIGLSSVKERVDRLKGYYDFTYKDRTYTALIMIPVEYD